MESRLFIKSATALITRIKDQALVASIGREDSSESDSIQKQIHTTFSGLQNPTLPSAGKLLAEATEHGYDVDQRVQHRIWQAEQLWH